MDLLSSGDDALMMGQVPSEFQADRPIFIFQPSAPDTFTHTCTAPQGMVVGTCCLQGGSPYHVEGPL